MAEKTNRNTDTTDPGRSEGFHLSEDWLSVLLAFLIIILSALGILGKSGLPITF